MKALCLIDLQNDFTDFNGALYISEAEKIIPDVCKLIKNRAYNDTILITTQDTHYENNYLDTLEGMHLPFKHCIDDTWGWEINYDVARAIDSVARQYAGVTNVEKETFGSFDLMEAIDRYTDELEEIIFAGVCTDICLIANVALAKSYFPEVPITVVERCCAGSTPERHVAAIEVMKSLQVHVI